MLCVHQTVVALKDEWMTNWAHKLGNEGGCEEVWMLRFAFSTSNSGKNFVVHC